MTDVTSAVSTGVTNMTTFKDFINVANASAMGYMFTGIDFMVFFILLITMAGAGYNWESALLSSGFICLVLSILFLFMGIVPFWVVGVFIAIIIVAIFSSVLGNKYD